MLASFVAVAIIACTPLFAQGEGEIPAVRIRPGAIEFGIAGSMTVVQSVASATVLGRCGSFVGAFGGVGGYELSAAYSHVSFLDQVDLEGGVSWGVPVAASSVVPFIAIGGGVRQEWIGSFSGLRYLAGADAGVRALMGNRAAIRAEYSFRRVLHDPVADYSEHRIMLGISILFKNSGGH